MSRGYPQNLPDGYALENLAKAVRWDADAQLGPALRTYWPQVFPGIGVEAAYGFAVNGGPNDDTADSATAHAPFHEMGLFGVTGGPWSEAAPNCDRSESNDWCLVHASPEVTALLGRAACMEAECWRLSRGGAADQIAVGIVSLARNGLSMMRRLPTAVWPTDTGLWFMALACMGWSAGTGGAVAHLQPYLAALAAVPEASRFVELQRRMALDAYDRSLGGAPGSHSNPAHTLIRTLEKLRTALFLAVLWESRGSSLRLWACSVAPDPDAQRWIDLALGMRAAGLSPAQQGLPPADPGWWNAPNYGTLALSFYGS